MPPKRRASRPVPRKKQTPLDVRVFVAAVGVAALGYSLLPSVASLVNVDSGGQFVPIYLTPLGSAIAVMTLFRCVVAGCIAGLIVSAPNPRWAAPAATSLGVAAGTLAVALATSSAVDIAATAAGTVLACGAALTASWLVSENLTALAESLAMCIVAGVLLSCVGVLPGIAPGADLQSWEGRLSVPPQPRAYSQDTAIYLRTYYLMKHGEGYYAAFRQSTLDDAFKLSLSSPFNYREPFVFYLWKTLPGDSGAAVLDWFFVYAVLVLICSYLVASSLVARGAALLAPVALIPWFTYLSWTLWFPATEIWAAGFGLAAVMCLVRKWRIPSLVLLTAAVAAREFMVLLIPAWLLVAWFSDHPRRTWWFPVAAVLGPVVVLGAHFLAVPATSGSAGVNWFQGGPARLASALRFGFDLMPAAQWMPVCIAAAGIAGAALARPLWKRAALLAATVLPTLFLFVLSGGSAWYYWGGFYIPLAVAIAPAVFARLLPPKAVSA